EITLGGMLYDEIVEADKLPLLYAGVSHCFRTEAGAHGKASKGLYRVHQFTKVEMFAFVKPDESDAMHERILGLEEQIFQGLGIPYRVVDVCTGDLGGPAYRKYDIEAWMPGRGEAGEWGEVTSTSNCTDYQARRLKIRYRPEPGAKPEFLHMLNGTAIAVSRAWIAVVENYQQADGTILLPEVLRPYMGTDRIAALR
ncbi:MAG: serine--tRNA ligase, partial [Verrucomicrobiota bacterium]|nr:serine--tRNA ligase [Verrucomicrobiota bacterium]